MRRFGINTVGDDTSSDANWKPSSDADDSSPSLPVRGGPPQRSVLTRSTSRRGSTSSEEGSGTSNIKFEQGRGSSSKLVQLPDDLPEDCIRPTKENTFSNPYQREMLEILESGGGIFALVRHLVDLERQKPPTPKPSSSTLLHSDPVEAFNLFACMSRPKLHSILSNTYVPDTIMQKWHVDSVIHQPQERADKLDPGQYLNLLSPRSGVPLTVDKFRRFIRALEIASGLLPDDAARKAANEFRDSRGKNLGARFHQKWNDFYNNKGIVLRDYPLPGGRALSQDAAGFDQLPAGLDADSDNEEDDDNETEESDEEEDVNPFVMTRRIRNGLAEVYTCWTKFLANMPKEIIYVPLPAEVGWAIYCYDRVLSHQRLQSTNMLYKVIVVMLQMLFPEEDIVMYQFSLSHVWQPKHAAVGESIWHHAAASYRAYGGVNGEQAGLHVRGAEQRQPTDYVRWENILNLRYDDGTMTRVENNAYAEKCRLQKAMEIAKEAADLVTAEEAVRKKEEEARLAEASYQQCFESVQHEAKVRAEWAEETNRVVSAADRVFDAAKALVDEVEKQDTDAMEEDV